MVGTSNLSVPGMAMDFNFHVGILEWSCWFVMVCPLSASVFTGNIFKMLMLVTWITHILYVHMPSYANPI